MLDYNKLREEYKPDSIRLLLIGEAPPNGGNRYFYEVPVKEYDYLFMAVFQAIDEVYFYEYERTKRPKEMKESILSTLRYKGVFVTDLCHIPEDKLPDGKTAFSFSEDFVKEIKSLPLADDCKIIIFKAGGKIKPLLDKEGIECEIVPLSRGEEGGKGLFISRFRELYKGLKRR